MRRPEVPRLVLLEVPLLRRERLGVREGGRERRNERAPRARRRRAPGASRDRERRRQPGDDPVPGRRADAVRPRRRRAGKGPRAGCVGNRRRDGRPRPVGLLLLELDGRRARDRALGSLDARGRHGGRARAPRPRPWRGRRARVPQASRYGRRHRRLHHGGVRAGRVGDQRPDRRPVGRRRTSLRARRPARPWTSPVSETAPP